MREYEEIIRIQFDTNGRIHHIDGEMLTPTEDDIGDDLCDVIYADGKVWDKVFRINQDGSWEDISDQYDHGTWLGDREKTLEEATAMRAAWVRAAEENKVESEG